MRQVIETFCKKRSCPSTETLLLFSRARLEEIETSNVAEHLTECEFCCAEVHLLTQHPPFEAKCITPEMPFQLRQIAEILLGTQQPQFQLLRVFLVGQRFLSHTEIALSA